jgi:hypothetical protein
LFPRDNFKKAHESDAIAPIGKKRNIQNTPRAHRIAGAHRKICETGVAKNENEVAALCSLLFSKIFNMKIICGFSCALGLVTNALPKKSKFARKFQEKFDI